jgi:hypothetical protein
VLLLGFPLLLVPLAIYNIIAFLTPGVAWDGKLLTIGMMSGAEWTITLSDLMIVLALFLLFFEIVKATRQTRRSILDHLLSTLVFVAAIVEFLLVRQAGTSLFAILIVVCLVDVVAGYSVSIRSAGRNYTVERETV